MASNAGTYGFLTDLLRGVQTGILETREMNQWREKQAIENKADYEKQMNLFNQQLKLQQEEYDRREKLEQVKKKEDDAAKLYAAGVNRYLEVADPYDVSKYYSDHGLEMTPDQVVLSRALDKKQKTDKFIAIITENPSDDYAKLLAPSYGYTADEGVTLAKSIRSGNVNYQASIIDKKLKETNLDLAKQMLSIKVKQALIDQGKDIAEVNRIYALLPKEIEKIESEIYKNRITISKEDIATQKNNYIQKLYQTIAGSDPYLIEDPEILKLINETVNSIFEKFPVTVPKLAGQTGKPTVAGGKSYALTIPNSSDMSGLLGNGIKGVDNFTDANKPTASKPTKTVSKNTPSKPLPTMNPDKVSFFKKNWGKLDKKTKSKANSDPKIQKELMKRAGLTWSKDRWNRLTKGSF